MAYGFKADSLVQGLPEGVDTWKSDTEILILKRNECSKMGKGVIIWLRLSLFDRGLDFANMLDRDTN